MNQIILLFIILVLSLQSSVFAQNNEVMTLTSFVPKTQAYDIYYPSDFQLLEGDDGIVTITDTVSGLNITLSSYTLKSKPKDHELMTVLNSFINDSYNKKHKIEDWKSYTSKFDNLVELRTHFNNSNWIWYGINNKKSIVVLSLNKETEITDEEVALIQFIIDRLIIN